MRVTTLTLETVAASRSGGSSSSSSPAIASHPAAQWSLSGHSGFVTAIAAQLRNAGVPARSIHKNAFWGVGTPSTAVRPGELAPLDRGGSCPRESAPAI